MGQLELVHKLINTPNKDALLHFEVAVSIHLVYSAPST